MYSSIINGEPTTFGTSGMLYRSNKLMYDRLTGTVWNHLKGEPAWGPLWDSGIKLSFFPVLLTTWGEWLAEHPDTTVLALDTGVYPARSYLPENNPNAIYFDYFNSADTMFPVWQRDGALDIKDVALTVSLAGADKAYPVEILQIERIVNDALGGIEIVVVASAETQAARIYAREGRVFRLADEDDRGIPTMLVDTDGVAWEATEERLVNTADPSQTLARVPSHMAFWFGWFAFHPETERYEGR